MALYAAYGAAVKALPAAAWQRLRVGCAPLEGDSFAMVVRRARFAARAQDVFAAFPAPKRIRLVASANRATLATIGVVAELLEEFNGHVGVSPAVLAKVDRGRSDYAHGWFDIEGALRTAEASAGVATAVRAAGLAVLRHDWHSPGGFAEAYRYVEPEVPYANVERDAEQR